MIRLSIIVPAFNEEATIAELLAAVMEQKIDGFELEVTVVDDGSTDQTAKILEANPRFYSKFIKLPQNRGKSAAVATALRQATGDYVLFQDSDLKYCPSEYHKLVRPIADLNADLIMGSRFMALDVIRVFYFWNKIGNRLITLFFNILHNTTFTGIYSCYLLFRRDLVPAENLRRMGWNQHAEILSIAQRNARIIYEVPISYHGRTFEEGKKIRARYIFKIIWTIFIQRLTPIDSKPLGRSN